MLKIRLQRVGKKNDPYFRIVVTQHTNKAKTGKPVEIVGSHDVQKGGVKFEADRIKYWISVGAKPTPTINNMLVTAGIINTKKQKTVKKLVKKEGKKK
jgi:small subunit ribosomal protein S16